MTLEGQRLDPDRYALIPRTISFLIRQNEILLIKLASDRGGWSGQYNGIGGHMESGEDPLAAARREVLEETGLQTEQRLCGVVTIHMEGTLGIGLFVFVGEVVGNDPLSRGPEGAPAWLPVDRLADYDLVEDLGFLIPKALKARSEKDVFFAAYSYDAESKLQIARSE